MATVPLPRGDTEAKLGETFKTIRRSRRVWLRDLAKHLGVSVNTVRWHEAGARMMRVDLVIAAAKCMGVDPCELLRDPPQTSGEIDGNESNR